MVKLTSRETLTRVFNGKDSYVLSLSNDTHTISTNADGTGGSFTEAKTTLTVYKGGVDDTANWTLSYTNGTGISGSLYGTTYSVTGMTVDNGIVTLKATNKADSSLVLTKKFTLSKSRNGEPGVSYSLVVLSGKTIKKYKDRLVTDSDGVPSINKGIEYDGNIHARILKYRSGTQTTVNGFFEIIEVGAETGSQTTKFFSSTASQEVRYNLSTADLSNVIIKVYSDRNKTTLLDVASVDIISDGQPSITIVNTNPNISLPADYKGVITDYSASTGEILVYEGTTDVTSLSTFSVLEGNRNLYSLSGFSNFQTSPSISNVTKNAQTGDITVTVSGNDPYVGGAINTGSNWNATFGPKIPIKPGRDMFVTITNPIFTKNYINFLDSNGTATKNGVSFVDTNKFKVPSSSFSENDKFINLRFGIKNGVGEIGKSYTTKIKVEYSSHGTDWTPNPDDLGYQDSDYLDVAPDGSFSFYPISNTKDFVKANIKISYRDMVFTSSVNLTKTKAGKDGSDAKLLFLTSDKQIFTLNKDGTPKESSITVRALNQNVEGDATFTVKGIKENGTTELVSVNPSNNTITLPSVLATKYSQIEVKATIADLHDTLTISVVRDGSPSVTAFLTNEAVTLAASNTGVVTAASYNGAKGYFKIYEGSTDVSTSATYTVTPPTGVTATISASGAYAVTSVAANLDTTLVTFVATYKGQTYSKDFSISKSKMGAAGINAKMLTLSSDRDYFAFDKEGQAKPSNQTIHVSANLHNISGNPTFEVKGYNANNAATTISLTPSGTNLSIPVSEMGSYIYLTVKATLTVEGITYSDIKTFSRVTDGSQALTGWLTNESITVPASNMGTVLSSDLAYLTGTFKVFYGSEDVTTSSSFSYTRNDNAYTFNINDSGVYSITTLSASLDTFSIPLTATYKGKTISKVLTISKSKMGSPGQDAKILSITTTRDYFAFDKEGQAKPTDQKVTITAHLKNIAGTASFEVKGYDSSNHATKISLAPTAVNVLEIPVAQMASYVYLTVRAYVSVNNATYEDFTTISRVTDGSQALVGLLTNESITVPANSSGVVSSTDLAYLTGSFKVFYGSEDVTALSKFSYTRDDSAYTFAINSSGVYTISALNASMDTFSIPVKATYKDKEVGKVISISKSKTGAAGSNAKILTLTSDIQVFTLDKDGNPKGSNITVRALLQNLTGAVGFTVKGVKANGSETTISVSPTNNSFTLDKNLAKTYDLVKITASLSGLTDTLTLPVVKDATLNITGVLTKESAVLAAANDGSVSTDAYNETKGYFKVYEGSTEVTGSTTFSVDRNLVIKHTATSGIRLGTENLFSDPKHSTTAYFPVEPNVPYTLRTYETVSESDCWYSLAFYSNDNANGSGWIERPSGPASANDLKNGRTFISPANARFARVSYPTSHPKVKLTKGKYTSDYTLAPEDSGVNAVINADGSYAVTSIPKNLDTVSVTLNGDYKGTRVTKVFTISKSKMGAAGLSARILNLSSTRDYFSYDRDNQPKPAGQTITFNANLNNLSGTTRFEVKGYNASNVATVINLTSTTPNVLTLPISAMGSYVYITVRAYITSDNKTYEDTKTISRVMDGSQTLVGWLTNESITVPATNNGSVSSTDLAYITGTFKVFYGSEDVTTGSTFSYTRNDNAYTFSINNSGVYTVSALSTSLDSFSIPIKATYKGKEVSKVLSISKSRTGSNGTSAYMWIMYAKDKNGTDAVTIVTPDKEAEYTYIGIALTNTPERPAADSGKYTWTRYTGKDGIGINGRSVHIKYSNDGGKTFTGNNGEVAGKYIGIYVDDKLEDSNNPADYTWNKAQGDDALPTYPNLISKGTLRGVRSNLDYDAKTNTYTVTTTEGNTSLGSGIVIPDTQVQYVESYRVSAYVYVDSAEESLFVVDFNNRVEGVPTTNDHDWRDDSIIDGHSGNDNTSRVPGRTWHLVYWGTTNKVPELIDESKFTKGYLSYTGNGQILPQENQAELTSDFIKITSNRIPYIFKFSVSLADGQYAWAVWQFFDSNKQPVGGRQGYGRVNDSSGKWSRTSEITAPDGAAYIRLSFGSCGNGHISFKRGLNPNEVPMYVQDTFGIRATTAPKVFKIRDVKLELGKHVTPWVGSEEDLKGDPGVDAITPVLTNESITIPSDSDGNVSSSILSKVTTTVKIYKGTGELTNLTSWTFSASTLNGSGTYTMSGATLKLTGITSETLNIQITASHQTYGTYNRVFTVTKVYRGEDAKLLILSADKQIFSLDKDGNPTGSNITVTANLQNLSGAVGFTVKGVKADNSEVGIPVNSVNNTITLDKALAKTYKHIKVTGTLSGLSDTTTINVVRDGSPAVTTSLTNEAVTLPANHDGVVATNDYSLANGSFQVYEGNTDVSSNATFAPANLFSVTGIDPSSISKNHISKVVTNNGTGEITITVSGDDPFISWTCGANDTYNPGLGPKIPVITGQDIHVHFTNSLFIKNFVNFFNESNTTIKQYTSFGGKREFVIPASTLTGVSYITLRFGLNDRVGEVGKSYTTKVLVGYGSNIPTEWIPNFTDLGVTAYISSTGNYQVTNISNSLDVANLGFSAIYQGKAYNRIFTVTKSKASLNGVDAKLLSINADRSYFSYDCDNQPKPANQVIKIPATLINMTGNPIFEVTGYKNTSSTGTALNVVQLGEGRNLLSKTNRGKTNWSWSISSGGTAAEDYNVDGINAVKLTRTSDDSFSWAYIQYQGLLRNLIEPNTKYTLSFDVKPSQNVTFTATLMRGDAVGECTNGTATMNKALANQWTKVSCVLTTKTTLPNESGQVVYLQGMPATKDNYLIIKNIKLEKGDTQTPYSPAPEDFTNVETTQPTVSGSTLTLPVAAMGSYDYLKVNSHIDSDGTTYSDTETISRVTDGSQALVGWLTNESISVPATATGTVASSDLAQLTGTFKVFYGSTDVTNSATFSYTRNDSQYTFTISSGGVYSVTALSSSVDSFSIPIKATYKGKEVSKTLSISKSKTGTNGRSITSTTVTFWHGLSASKHPLGAECGSRDHTFGNTFNVTSGKTYTVRVIAEKTKGNLPLQGGIWYTEQSTGNSFDGYNKFTQVSEPNEGGLAIWERKVTVPSGKTKGQMYIQLEQTSGNYNTAYRIYDAQIFDPNGNPLITVEEDRFGSLPQPKAAPNGTYIWKRTVLTYSDNTTSTFWEYSGIGANGSAAAVNITPALLPGYNLSYVPWDYAATNPSAISPTGNGWARFYLKNTSGSEKNIGFQLPKVEGLTEGVSYTFLMEVRNNKSTYVENFWVTGNREAAFSNLGTTGELLIATNQSDGVKRAIAKVNCPGGLNAARILTEVYIRIPNGQTLDAEFRLSIYLGEYQGSYLPYQGSKNPYYYDMSLSSLVVTKNPSNTFSPASITATVNKFSDGETVPANAVYKVIEFNSAGTQLKTITTESVASKTYTISNVNCSYLTIYAYNPNNTAEEWDHQTVYVVKDGTDSYSMDIVSDKGFIFSFDKDNNAVGFTQITLTPRITGNFTPSSYAWTKNGTAAGTSGVLTINASELKSTNNITVGLTVNGKSAGVAATLTNYVNVTKAKDGSDAYIVHLSREVTAFPTNESGTLLGNLTNNTTTVTAYKGTNAITPTITNLTTSGCTASYSGTTVTITGISADSGYVDIAISLEGKSVGTKRFSFVKVRQGQTMRIYNAWANSADGTVDFSTTESLGKKYIGVCTTTATTAPTTPSAYKWTETANNFTYGGRNWLMNSDLLEDKDYWTTYKPSNGQTEVRTDSNDSVKYFRIKNTTSNGSSFGVFNDGLMPVIKGDKVTVSGYIRASDSTKIASILKLEERNVSGDSVNYQIYNWNSTEVKWDKPFVQNDTWYHFHVTYTIANENTRLLQFFMRVDRGTVDYKHLKLEAGNVATQWSPSPDDYARRLAAVRAKADKANADIADMADDGKLTPLEKTQISREVETIKAEYPIFIAQANTYGVSDEKNTYTARYNSLINFVNPLLANMSVTSDLNIATFKAAFKDYYTSRTNLLNKIYKTLNDNTTNTASIIRKQISNVIQDITGWSVTTSDTYLTNATGSAQTKILDQLKSTIQTTAKSIDLTVSSTTTGKKLNDNYYNKSQADSRYATISITDNRINLMVNGQTKTSFQINDGNIVFDLSGGGGTTTKVGTYTAYAWSPDGKDRFTKTKPQENMLVFSSNTANYAKSAPAPFVELNDNERYNTVTYQDQGWFSKDQTKTLRDLGYKVGDKLSVLFKLTVKHGGGNSFQVKSWGASNWAIVDRFTSSPGTYVVRSTNTLNEDALKTRGFHYLVWAPNNYLQNSKSFTGSNITGSSTLLNETYQGFPVRYYNSANHNISNYDELFQFNSFAALRPSQTYTVSFWAKGTGKVRVYLHGNGNFLQVKTAKTNQNVTASFVDRWGDGAIDFTLSSSWQRYWVTYTMKDAFPTSDTSFTNHLLFRHLAEFGNTEQWFSGIQFEEGSTANTYTYLQSVQFGEMKIYREENNKEVFTLNPQDSYTESEPLYMGTSILDSDNPADYKWELNPARKPITVYSNDDDFLLPSISEPRPNLIDNSDFRDISQWQWLNQSSVHNDGSGENYVELSDYDYIYYSNTNNGRKFIRLSKTSALTLSFDYKEDVRINRDVAFVEIHSTETGSSILQRISLPIGSFKGENINEMNKWKRIYYTFQNNFRQDVWIAIAFYGSKGRNLAQKTSKDWSAPVTGFWGGQNTCFNICKVITDGLEVGDTFKTRIVLKYTNIVPASGQTAKIWIQGAGNVTDWNSGAYPSGGGGLRSLSGSGEIVFELTDKINADHLKNSYWDLAFRTDYIASGSLQWKLAKVEKGTLFTDWSPAPEDLSNVTGPTTNRRYFRKPKLEVSDVPTPWQEKDSDIPKYIGTGMKPSLSYKDFEWSLNPKWVEDFTKRGLDSTVNINDYVNKIGEINSSISNKANQSDLDSVKSTADSVNNSFNDFVKPNTGKHDKDIAAATAKAESNLNAFKEQVVTFKFTNLISKIGDTGISISDTNQSMKMNLTNNRLEFTENGIVSAYISGKQFYITNGTITDIFQIGKHQFQKYNDEHTVVRWIK